MWIGIVGKINKEVMYEIGHALAQLWGNPCKHWLKPLCAETPKSNIQLHKHSENTIFQTWNQYPIAQRFLRQNDPFSPLWTPKTAPLSHSETHLFQSSRTQFFAKYAVIYEKWALSRRRNQYIRTQRDKNGHNRLETKQFNKLGMHMTQPNAISCVSNSDSATRLRGWLSQLHTQFQQLLIRL